MGHQALESDWQGFQPQYQHCFFQQVAALGCEQCKSCCRPCAPPTSMVAALLRGLVNVSSLTSTLIIWLVHTFFCFTHSWGNKWNSKVHRRWEWEDRTVLHPASCTHRGHVTSGWPIPFSCPLEIILRSSG